MNKTTDLRELLYQKMSNEQEQYIEKLRLSKPDEIISAAYEKVMRDDILMTFEDDNFLESNQIKQLLKLDYPLSACYNEWMDTDYSHMEMLRDTIESFSDKLVSENESQQKKNSKNRDEPER